MIRYFIPAIVWLIVSVILLTLPGSAFPKQNWLNGLHFDKLVHIGMFSLLCFLICWGLYRSDRQRKRLRWFFVFVAIDCFLFGVVMEYVQRDFVPNRSFDTGDIVADGIGAILGLIYSWKRFIKK